VFHRADLKGAKLFYHFNRKLSDTFMQVWHRCEVTDFVIYEEISLKKQQDRGFTTKHANAF